MAYKLAIAEIVGVLVKGSTRDQDGAEQPFEFTLHCDRLPAEALKAVIVDDTVTANDWFCKHARGWRGQRLVLDEAGQAADFGVEALRVLFSIGGMSAVCWRAYLNQVLATEKN